MYAQHDDPANLAERRIYMSGNEQFVYRTPPLRPEEPDESSGYESSLYSYEAQVPSPPPSECTPDVRQQYARILWMIRLGDIDYGALARVIRPIGQATHSIPELAIEHEVTVIIAAMAAELCFRHLQEMEVILAMDEAYKVEGRSISFDDEDPNAKKEQLKMLLHLFIAVFCNKRLKIKEPHCFLHHALMIMKLLDYRVLQFRPNCYAAVYLPGTFVGPIGNYSVLVHVRGAGESAQYGMRVVHPFHGLLRLASITDFDGAMRIYAEPRMNRDPLDLHIEVLCWYSLTPVQKRSIVSKFNHIILHRPLRVTTD